MLSLKKKKIAKKKIGKSHAKKRIKKRTTKRKKNPIGTWGVTKGIPFHLLFDDISENLGDILYYEIYGRNYYDDDVRKGIDHRSVKDIIRIFEDHIGIYRPILTPEEIVEYRYLINEMKRLPSDAYIILPQEFGTNLTPKNKILNEFTIPAFKAKEQRRPMRPMHKRILEERTRSFRVR